MERNVLVTGGAGYIGSHTCKALAYAGFNPVTLDDLSSGHRWAVKWGPLIEGDVSNAALVRRTVRTFRIGSVVHFAGSAYVGESMEHPGKYFGNNTTNTVKLLDALLAEGVRTIVFSSTCATYGIPETVPIAEAHPQRPVNPYGESKLFVERMLTWYERAHAIRYAALRYFNAAGADADGDIGEDHDPETHLIPLVIAAARRRAPPVSILGTDYPTPDGTAIRDYVHVADLAHAHVLALERLIDGAASMALNLGTGRGHSVRDVIRAVEAIGRRPVPCVEAARRPGDPPVLVAASGEARRVLGWVARDSELRTIIETAWSWHAAHTARRTRRPRVASAA